jgi:hypothetical protein
VWVSGGYALLQNGDRLDGTAALAAAEQILPGAYLTPIPEGGGDRICFAAENVSMAISAVEGKLLSLICDRQVLGETEGIGEAAAQAAAESALAEYIRTPAELLSSVEGEGCYYFTFAPRWDGVLCLSEKIIVGIDGAVGKLCLWDAEGYYRYRTPLRILPGGMLSPEEAAGRYGGAPVILCTAVRSDGREIYCYRLGDGEGTLYLNAVTGRMEEILPAGATDGGVYILV